MERGTNTTDTTIGDTAIETRGAASHRGDGDRDNLAYEPLDRIRTTMIHFLAPIALVSYAVAAITGSCFAIVLASAWCALDKIVTRAIIKQRARRERARTVVIVSGEEKTYV